MAYESWSEFVNNEPAANYTLEVNDQRSQWAFLAIHGQDLERLSADLAREVAAANRLSFYGLLLHDTTQPPANNRMRIQATNYDEPKCLALQGNASYTLSVHAISDVAELPDDLGKIRVRGIDATRQRRITEELTEAGFEVVNKGEEGDAFGGERGDALNPENIAAKNRNKEGVNLEMDLTFRKTLVTDPNDLNSAKNANWAKLVKALGDYSGTYDKYYRWGDLIAIEKEGTDYRIEESSPGSRWSHLAIHGGGIELMTASLAKAAAEKAKQKYWALWGTKAANNGDLHITSTRFDNGDCLTMQSSVGFTVSYHGMSNATSGVTTPKAFVGGLDTANRDKIIAALKAKGFNAVLADATHGELNGDDPNNICNRNRSKKGVQVEMNRALRDSFVQSGNAADEGTSPVTQKFNDFVDAIYSVVYEEVTPVTERPFDVGEPGVAVFPTDAAPKGVRVVQQAIHDEITNDVFTTQVIDGGIQLAGESAPVSGAQRSANGDLTISRLDNTGKLVSFMYARKFDHGSSLSGIENVGGTIYLWLGADAKVVPIGDNGHATKIGRLKYTANAVVDKGDPELQLYNPVPDPALEYIAPGLDFVNNRMWIYYQKAGGHYYTPYAFDEFKKGNYTPLWPTIGPIRSPAGAIRQNFTVFGDWIYQFHGTGYDDKNPPYPEGIGNAHLMIINAKTGEIVEDHIRNTELNYTYREPEAIGIWSPVNNPRLMYGWATGESGGRKLHLRNISSRWPYRNFADLAEHQNEGTDYKIHYNAGSPTAAAPNDVSQIAIHGDRQELFTMKLAKAVADKNKNQFFAVEGTKGSTPPDNNAVLRIPATKFDHPQAVQMQQSVEFSFSYHGRADDTDDPADGIARIGGLDRVNGARLMNELEACGIATEYGGREGGGWGDHTSPQNIVNRNVSGAGVQIELSRALRNRMSSTGDAGDAGAGFSALGQCFINAVSKIADDPHNNDEQEEGGDKCIRYFINGYELNQPQRGIRLMGGTEWASSISPRRFELDLPKWHGQMAMWHDPLDTMKVTFEVEITAGTNSLLRQRYNDFVSLCGTGKWIPVLMHRQRGIYLQSDTEHDFADTNAPYREYASAQLESLSAPEYEHAGRRLTTTCVFNVPAGQWRSNKIYTQSFTKRGNNQKCIVAKVSSVPVYSMIVRVQGGPGGDRNLRAWSLVDSHSNTGIAWDDPVGINLNNGEWLYCNTDNMRAYISAKKDMIKPSEPWSTFIERIEGKAAWSNFRYIRNGPISLSHKLTWEQKEGQDEPTLHHTSGVNIAMTAIDGNGVDRELTIRAHAANR